MRSPRLLPVVAAALLCLGAPAPAQNVDVDEFVLDNGMTWLLVPRTEEPNTVSVGWLAKVGSVNERPGITGISHFFEHMMFKGTTTVGTRDPELDADFMRRQKAVKERMNALTFGVQYPRYFAGEIDDPWDPANDTDELRALRSQLRTLMDEHLEQAIVTNEFDSLYTNEGASGLNAFTSEDVTFYIIGLPSNKLELWCWMESDRLSDSVFREFYSERDVVHEERRLRLESSPTGELDEQFDAMFWMSSPYTWSVIGYPSDLNSYTREDFDEYFDVYYRPNNLVGIVVGDFDPAELKPMIERYFGRIERGAVEPPPVRTLEMPQVAEKRMLGSCDCQPQVEVRYHTVPFAHADSYALDMLAEILNGRTGRLYKSMVEGDEIASSAFVRQEGRKYAGLFSFRARTKGDATPSDLEAAWYREVERLKTEPVGDFELQKVKNQVTADSYRSLQSNGSIRIQLGIYESMGGWEYINEAPAELMAVTAEDITAVAQEYFRPENRSVAQYTRRDGAAPMDAALAALSPEMQEQAKQMIERMSEASPADLEMIVGSIESQLGAAPEEVRGMLEYVVAQLKAKVAAGSEEG